MMKTIEKGIRKKESGKYLVTKSIGKERYYAEFGTLREARSWKNQYHPLLNPEATEDKSIFTANDYSNGRDKEVDFGTVYQKYQEERMVLLSEYTQYKKELRANNFFSNLISIKMCGMNSRVVIGHLKLMKEYTAEDSRRCNFDKELKDLNAVFEWYRKEIDPTFKSPITKTHYLFGKIKDVEKKKKDMTLDQFMSFISHLKEPFQTLALIQFYLAGRIQEAAAINLGTVDFTEGTITISHKVIWKKGKPKLVPGTKTDEGFAVIKMNKEMADKLLALKKDIPKECILFFHYKGKLLRYDMILEQYNEALKAANLPFSGTHTVRHTMGTLSRKLGGLDACQAVLRHKSARMSEHYAKLDVNEKVTNVVIQAEELFKQAKNCQLKVGATNCDQNKKGGS